MDDRELTNLLKSKGVITDKQLESLAKTSNIGTDQTSDNLPLSKVLLQDGTITIEQLVETLSGTGKDVSQLIKTELHDLFQKYEVIAGKYIVVKKLDEGGMGIVYKAYETTLKRYVALKFLYSVSAESSERFRQEAETIAKLVHPNIVPIYDVGSYENKSYIAMQYLEGKTLTELGKSVDLKKCLNIILKVCDAIEYAHAHGIVHRDIKPSNVMVTSEGRVYVMDFGISKHSNEDPELTQENILGTPMYMSPEQARGERVDYRTDVYSIGATLYNCVTGVAPYSGTSSGEIVSKLLSGEPMRPRGVSADVPRDLEVIILKSMDRDSSFRYQSVSELRNDIERFLSGEPIKARSGYLSYVLLKRVRKYWIYGLVAAVGALVLLPIFLPMMKRSADAARMSGMEEVIEARRKASANFEKGMLYLNRAKYTPVKEDRKKISDYLKIAIDEFTSAVNSDVTFAEAYLRRGEIYFRMGNFVEAVSDFTLALERNRMLTEAYFLRIMGTFLDIFHDPALKVGQQVDLTKRYRSITEDYAKLSSMDVLPAYRKCAEGVLLRIQKMYDTKTLYDSFDENHFDQVCNVFGNAIKADPSLMYPYLMRGIFRVDRQAYFSGTKRYPERSQVLSLALEDMQKAIELEPNYALLHKISARVYSLLGQHEMGFRCVQEAKELSPVKDPMLALQEAHLNSVAGRKKAGSQLLFQSRELDKDCKNKDEQLRLQIERSQAFLEFGLNDEAIKELEKAFKGAPQQWQEVIRKFKDQIHIVEVKPEAQDPEKKEKSGQ